MSKVIGIEIVDDRTAHARCDEGFLRVRRYRARNRRDDGSASREYPIDVVERATVDAVAVCLYARTALGIEVLTRRGLRPAVAFRKDRRTAIAEGEYLLLEELVAGVVEEGETGIEALRRRAADETREECGISVPPERFGVLGGPFFVHPGVSSDKIHLLAAEVPRGVHQGVFAAPETGDGSALEEGAELCWRRLEDAISACAHGEIEDAKTEIAFRRLAALLQAD